MYTLSEPQRLPGFSPRCPAYGFRRKQLSPPLKRRLRVEECVLCSEGPFPREKGLFSLVRPFRMLVVQRKRSPESEGSSIRSVTFVLSEPQRLQGYPHGARPMGFAENGGAPLWKGDFVCRSASCATKALSREKGPFFVLLRDLSRIIIEGGTS